MKVQKGGGGTVEKQMRQGEELGGDSTVSSKVVKGEERSGNHKRKQRKEN